MRHREQSDLPDTGSEAYTRLSAEIKKLVKESPSLRLVFLCSLGKDAILKVGTWFLSLLNWLDS